MSSTKARPCEEGTIRSIRVALDCAASTKSWVLLTTILASSIAYIDESIVNVALPAIETDLATSVIVVQWLINAYTLTLSSLLLVGGAAGDRFGRRRLFTTGISIFAAASLWCGISPNVTQLISARAVQGVGAALLIPSSLAIIGATFAENERGKAIGTWAGFSALAAAVGPLLVGGLSIISVGAGFFSLTPSSQCRRSGSPFITYRRAAIRKQSQDSTGKAHSLC